MTQAATGPRTDAQTNAGQGDANEPDILVVARQQVLERGDGFSQDQVLQVLQLPDDRLEELLALAHEVRLPWCGPEVEVEGIVSQDRRLPRGLSLLLPVVPVRHPGQGHPLPRRPRRCCRPPRRHGAAGASEFCIVLAVRGPDERTMQRILELVPMVQASHRPSMSP